MISTSGLHIDQAPPLTIPFRFFATAPLFMAIAGGGMMGWPDDMLVSPLISETVTVVHMTVLGWLTMVMFGAMYQMIPVLAGVPVPRLRWAAWVYGSLFIGVASFLELGLSLHRWLLLSASIGLFVAVLMFVFPIGYALVRAPAKHPTVVAMRMAVLSLVAAMMMGETFLGEYAHGFMEYDRHAMVGIHLTWGGLGWVTTLIVGVSFQVLPMFYMMPQFPTRGANWVLAGIGITLLALPAALFWGTLPWIVLAALPSIAALVTYAILLRRIMPQRKRQINDSTYRFWQLGLTCGAGAMLLIGAWPFLEAEWLRYLFGTLFLYGFAGSIILGMLYKIVPFLVWFHRFSRLVGFAQVPMMDDLVPETSAKWHLPVHGAMLAAMILAALTSQSLFLISAGVLLIISAGQVAYMIWFALRPKPPEMPQMPDFNDFFKDMPKQP